MHGVAPPATVPAPIWCVICSNLTASSHVSCYFRNYLLRFSHNTSRRVHILKPRLLHQTHRSQPSSGIETSSCLCVRLVERKKYRATKYTHAPRSEEEESRVSTKLVEACMNFMPCRTSPMFNTGKLFQVKLQRSTRLAGVIVRISTDICHFVDSSLLHEKVRNKQ